MMHILISGGTGLIGRALTRSLLADGHHVSILSRSPQKYIADFPGAELLKWDGRTPDGWAHALAQADAVVNLAGAGVADKRWTPARKRLILESRINAGKAIVAAIEQSPRKPAVLIQSSAVGFYGTDTGNTLITEDSPAGDDFLAQVCVAWEESTAAIESLGVRRAVIRTGVVLAKEGGALPRMALPFRFFVGGRIAGGQQFTPWIHIADEVAAIRFLLENEAAHGTFNLSAPKPVTNAEFSRALGKALHRPALIPVPALALKALFGEMASVLLDGQRAIPQNLQSLGFTFHYSDVAAALRDLL